MPVQREKVVRAAEKLVSRGKIDAAIREYRKVLDDQPDDATTLNRVGDLYARTDRPDEAIKLFSHIAEGYTADGFFVKAIAIYKKIIKLDPTRLEVYERLAGLYHRQGLLNEARTQYQVLADYYRKHDDAASAIGIYERMALIDPEDPAPRVKLAELYEEQELLDKAMGEYRRIAELMLGHGRAEQAEQVYRRALEVTADDLGFVTDAVRELEHAGQPTAAARLLAFAVERNPEAAAAAREEPSVDGSRLDAAEAAGEGPAPPASSLGDLGADLVLDLDEPLDLDGSLELDDSFDLGSELELAREIERAGEEIEAARAGEAAGEEIELDLDVETVASTSPAPAARGRSGKVEIDADFLERTAAELVPERIQQEDDLITEAEVLAKYGLADKATERVAELLELNPQHHAGLRLRVELLVDAGRTGEAAAAATLLRETVGEGSPAWSDAVRRLEKAGYTVEDRRIAPPPEAADEVEAVGAAGAAERAQGVEAVEPPAEEAEPVALAEEVAAEPTPSVDEAAAAGPAAEEDGLPERAAAEEPTTRPGRVPRDDRGIDSLLEEIADALLPGRRKKKQAAAARADAAPTVERLPATEAAPGPAPAAEPHLAGQPPATEARTGSDTPTEPPTQAEPPTEALTGRGAEWLETVGADPDATGAAGGGVFDQEEDFFDLAAEIEEELSREGGLDEDELLLEAPREQSLEEIVEGFKKGVSEALSPEDYATHLDLGIAYREMGLLDEAIGEFQIAAKAPAQLVQCCSMLGLSFLDKGLPELAVKWYRRGLAAPDLSEDDELGLLYDLGNAHFAMGERDEAYKTFVDIYGTNSNYRDVVAKLAETGPRAS